MAAVGTIVVSGNLSADGIGTGNGGTISISMDVSTTFRVGQGPTANGIYGSLSANAGAAGGGGGKVYLYNYYFPTGGGDIVVGSPAVISAKATAGNGGAIQLYSPGTVSIARGLYDVSAAGGNYKGGRIDITAQTFSTFGAAVPLTFRADGSGTGDGGSVFLQQQFAPLVVGLLAGQIQASARGGAISGNGGAIFIGAYQSSLTVDMAAASAGPQGGNSRGAVYGFSGNTLFVNGTIDARGLGTGNGGLISVSCSGCMMDLTSTSVSGVAGNLLADGGAAGGNGGQISVGGLDVRLDGTSVLTANGGTGGKGGVVSVYSDYSSGTTYIAGGLISTVGGRAPSDPFFDPIARVTLNAHRFVPQAGTALQIVGDATGTNNGSQIQISTDLPIDIGNGAGQIAISARGGSAGSVSGDGGKIDIYSEGTIRVTGSAVNVSPAGIKVRRSDHHCRRE